MKENLVIIHGWGKKDSWLNVLSYLNDYNVFLLDLPGLDFPLEKPFTFDDYLNYLEEKINLENFYLLGHSFGGALAMLYALKNTNKVKKLILYNPAIIREENLKTKISRFLAQVFKIFEKILPKNISYLAKKAYYKCIVRSYDYFLADDNLKKTFQNIRKDLKDLAKNLKVKTILLWGNKDKITPLKQGKILKNVISDSELIIFEGGHSYHKENPEDFTKKLREILK